MNEQKKTLIFIGCALLAVAVAYISQPKPVGTAPDDSIGKSLFEKFTDPLTAKSLEIVKFDSTQNQLSTFKVNQNSDGSWSIPSHGGYPADAENQLRDVATSLVDLKVIDVVSDLREDHEYFGVQAPEKDSKATQESMGTLIRMQDEKGDDLASLIVGKADKQKPDQRFVRVPSQERVYLVKIDPAKFTTKFGEWIEKDLLKLNALDVDQVRLRDYSVSRTERGFRMDPRLNAQVKWSSEKNGWDLAQLTLFNRGKEVPTSLGENEEINKEKLDALKTALDDLQIEDVSRKPKGLTADLKADAGFMNDQEGIDSLFTRGFFPLKPPTGDEVELFSANGEVHVGMKDGVEYILRFGNVAGIEEGSTETKLNRYLFVMARLDESKFAPPDLEVEPADVPSDKPAEKPAEKPAGGSGGACVADDDKPAADKPAADNKPAADDKPTADDKPAAEEKPAAAEKPAAEPAPPPAEKKIDIAAERERIKRDNQRKLDEFKERRKKAASRVQELNARFADWYFVISEDTYKKIHLGRADIIKEKAAAAAEEGTGLDSFRKLRDGGLQKGADDDHDHDHEGPGKPVPGRPVPGRPVPGGAAPGKPGGR